MKLRSPHRHRSIGLPALLLVVLACGMLDSTDWEMYDALLRDDRGKIEELRLQGYDLNRRITFDGWTPLTMATLKRDPELLIYLIDHGAEVDLPKTSPWSASSRTALSFTASHDDVPSSVALLLAGANPNSRDVSGQTPLHKAAASASPGTLLLLLKNGASVDGLDKPGASPLIYAAHADSPKALLCVQLLIDHGADPCIRDRKGQDAVDWSRGYDVAQVLRAAQASRRPGKRGC